MEANSQLLQRHHSDHDYNINNCDNYVDNNNNNNGNNNEEEEMREGGSGVGGSRWNPTKEQIEMLESIYSDEGVRTPSAEQIQQITTRLRVYGHIEGKNVFYWFQNHKARQRQKQKQHRLAAAAAALNHHTNHNYNHNYPINHINRFLGHHPPLPPSQPQPQPQPQHQYYQHGSVNHHHHLHPKPILPAPLMNNNHVYTHHHHQYPPNPNNVICSSFYKLPQTTNSNINNNLGFYPPHSPHYNYSAPAATKHVELPRGGGGVPHGSTLSGYCAAMMKGGDDHIGREMMLRSCMGTRTLDLFPVHPTGILEHKFGENSANNSAANSSGGSSSSDTDNTNGDGHNNKHQNFFDFFSSSHASSESD